MAEEVGFEPTVPLGTTVFKTAAIGHSATPPFNYSYQLTVASFQIEPRKVKYGKL